LCGSHTLFTDRCRYVNVATVEELDVVVAETVVYTDTNPLAFNQLYLKQISRALAHVITIVRVQQSLGTTTQPPPAFVVFVDAGGSRKPGRAVADLQQVGVEDDHLAAVKRSSRKAKLQAATLHQQAVSCCFVRPVQFACVASSDAGADHGVRR
jgi:hypothetical protein